MMFVFGPWLTTFSVHKTGNVARAPAASPPPGREPRHEVVPELRTNNVARKYPIPMNAVDWLSGRALKLQDVQYKMSDKH